MFGLVKEVHGCLDHGGLKFTPLTSNVWMLRIELQMADSTVSVATTTESSAFVVITATSGPDAAMAGQISLPEPYRQPWQGSHDPRLHPRALKARLRAWAPVSVLWGHHP